MTAPHEYASFAHFGHARRRFNSPLSEERVDTLAARLAARSPGSILDLGCGTGELLLELCARTGASGLGVDLDAPAIEEAARRTSQRSASRVEFRADEAAESLSGAWDAIVCIGSSHAFGGFQALLDAALPALAPGGTLLIGDGLWHRDPDAEYAAFLQDEGPFPTLEDRTREASALGWTVLDAEHATLAEWDAFENGFLAVARDWNELQGEAVTPDDAALLARREQWNATYRRHGRGTMGFAYLLLTRAQPA